MGYHAKDGWMFARQSDGSVSIQSPDGAAVVLDKNTWASAVAAVSAMGDTIYQHRDALWLHDVTEAEVAALLKDRASAKERSG